MNASIRLGVHAELATLLVGQHGLPYFIWKGRGGLDVESDSRDGCPSRYGSSTVTLGVRNASDYPVGPHGLAIGAHQQRHRWNSQPGQRASGAETSCSEFLLTAFDRASHKRELCGVQLPDTHVVRINLFANYSVRKERAGSATGIGQRVVNLMHGPRAQCPNGIGAAHTTIAPAAHEDATPVRQ